MTHTILEESGKDMNERCTDLIDLSNSPFSYTLSIIGGKWKMSILYVLSDYPCIRFNELQRKLQTITYKTLSVQLKELQADGLIDRKEYPQIPPKVEYRLSEKGKTIMPILDAICSWGYENMQEAGDENGG